MFLQMTLARRINHALCCRRRSGLAEQIIIRIEARLQPNIGFTLLPVLAVFTRSAVKYSFRLVCLSSLVADILIYCVRFYVMYGIFLFRFFTHCDCMFLCAAFVA